VQSFLEVSSKDLEPFVEILCLVLRDVKQVRICGGVSAWIFPGEMPDFRKGGRPVA